MEARKRASHRGFGVVSAATTATSAGGQRHAHSICRWVVVPLFLMQLANSRRELGTGIYTILIFASRSSLPIDDRPDAGIPGQENRSAEMKLASIFILTTPMVVLVARIGADARWSAGLQSRSHASVKFCTFNLPGNNNGSALPDCRRTRSSTTWARMAMCWAGSGRSGCARHRGSLRRRSAFRSPRDHAHSRPLFITLYRTILLIGVLNYVPALALAGGRTSCFPKPLKNTMARTQLRS